MLPIQSIMHNKCSHSHNSSLCPSSLFLKTNHRYLAYQGDISPLSCSLFYCYAVIANPQDDSDSSLANMLLHQILKMLSSLVLRTITTVKQICDMKGWPAFATFSFPWKMLSWGMQYVSASNILQETCWKCQEELSQIPNKQSVQSSTRTPSSTRQKHQLTWSSDS